MTAERKKHFKYVMPVSIQPVKDFSNDIFAFAATLLVVNVGVPEIAQSKVDTQLTRLLLEEWPHFLIYIISFLNISNYWMAHYRIFENIIRADKTLIRLNILLLLSVTFLPYPSQLMSQYGRHEVVAFIYGLSISFTYLMLTLITGYAYQNNRLTKPELHLPIRKIIMLREIIPLTMAVGGTGFAFFFPRLSFFIYLGVSLMFFLPTRLFMRGVDIITPDRSD